MPYKKLYLSENDRIIAGVCAGYAEYFETDPWLVRIIFIVLTIFGGSGILLYLISWFMIPDNNSTIENKQNPTGANGDAVSGTQTHGNQDSPDDQDHDRHYHHDHDNQSHREFIREMHLKMRRNDHNGHKIVGLVIVLVGALLLLNNIFPDFGFGRLWPVLLIIFGGIIMIGRHHHED